MVAEPVSDGGEADRAYSGVTLVSTASLSGSVVSVGVRFESLAGGARDCTVHLHSGLVCRLLGRRKFVGDRAAGAEVHLVGRLTAESGAGSAEIRVAAVGDLAVEDEAS